MESKVAEYILQQMAAIAMNLIIRKHFPIFGEDYFFIKTDFHISKQID